MAIKNRKNIPSDGGYYAIKGFVFQFDKSLLEILAEPQNEVEIEHVQDIESEMYYMQIKHKESQDYAHSKIRSAVIQLLKLSKSDLSKKFILYCYFKNKNTKRIYLNLKELNEILGKEQNSFSTAEKKAFTVAFTLEFADNFEKQFRQTIKTIKKSFKLKTFEEATMYHALFRASLLELALKKRGERKISFSILEELSKCSEKIVFEIAYSKYLTNVKYLTYLKKQYFTHKKPNIKDSERLFVVDIDESIHDPDIIQIITNISSRYYIQDVSAAPYICLTGLDRERYIKLKRKLWNKGLHFADGTHFAEDGFRTESCTEKLHKKPNNTIKYKLLNTLNLEALLTKHEFDESFIFLNPNSNNQDFNASTAKKFYLQKTKDLITIVA